MLFKSATDFFAAANGKRVSKTVTGVLTFDDWPNMVEVIKKQLLEQGAKEEDIKEEEDCIRIGSQFWRRPALRAHEEGLLKVRSKDYEFTPDRLAGGDRGGIFGDKKGCKVVGESLVKTYDRGMVVTFRII